MAGLSPAQAVTLIRRERGASCLFNEHFVRWLIIHGQQAAAAATRAVASQAEGEATLLAVASPSSRCDQTARTFSACGPF